MLHKISQSLNNYKYPLPFTYMEQLAPQFPENLKMLLSVGEPKTTSHWTPKTDKRNVYSKNLLRIKNQRENERKLKKMREKGTRVWISELKIDD